MTPPADSGSRKSTIAEKVLAVIAALLVVGSAYLGLQTARITQAKEQAQATAATKNVDLSLLQGQYNQLQNRYDQLQYENSDLKSQLGLPGPTADPQSPHAASVRHSGQLVLASGVTADLDSPSSDPQWQTGSSDIRYAPGTIIPYARALYLDDTKADYATCRNRTGYSSRNIDTGTVAVGGYLCINTTDKRYVALKITQLSPAQIAFDVVTYDPPDS